MQEHVFVTILVAFERFGRNRKKKVSNKFNLAHFFFTRNDNAFLVKPKQMSDD